MQLRVHGVATVDVAISMAARVGSLGELAMPHACLAVPAAAAANNMDLANVEGLEGHLAEERHRSSLLPRLGQFLPPLRPELQPRRLADL